MHNSTRRSILLIFLALLVILTSCSESEDTSVPANNTDDNSVTAEQLEYETTLAYIAEYHPFSEGVGEITAVGRGPINLNFAASNANGSSAIYTIDVFDALSSGYHALTDYSPLPESMGIENMSCLEDGSIIILERTVSGLTLRCLDTNGVEISQSNPEEATGETDFTSMAVDGNGNIYLSCGTELYVLGNDWQLLFTLTADGEITDMATLSDGSVGCLYETQMVESGGRLRVVNAEAKSWGNRVSVPPQARLFSNSGGYDLLYIIGPYLYGVDISELTSERILTFTSSAVNPFTLCWVCVYPTGTVYAMNSDATENGRGLIMMNEKKIKVYSGKTTLTYACEELDEDICREILEFNSTRDDCGIEIIDYSCYGNMAPDMLLSDIENGNVADIIDTTPFTVGYGGVDEEIFTDLMPYINSDDTLDLVTSAFEAASVNGRLYELFTEFQVVSVLGSEYDVGSEQNWSYDDFLTALENVYEGEGIFELGCTKSDVLRMCCYTCMDEFLSDEYGFDNEAFKNILAFTDMFPAEFDSEDYTPAEYDSELARLMTQRQLLKRVELTGFTGWQVYDRAMGGGVFVGLPVDIGNGSAFITGGKNMAISAGCEDKESAWEIVRLILTEEYQKNHITFFPTNRSLLENMAADALNADGEPEIIDSGIGVTIEVPAAASENEVNAVLSLIDSTVSVYREYEDIYDIIEASCAGYFDGTSSSEETAVDVQQSVNEYLKGIG